MADGLIFANGINATTGQALMPPLTSAAVSARCVGPALRQRRAAGARSEDRY